MSTPVVCTDCELRVILTKHSKCCFFLTTPKVWTPESYLGEPKEKQESCYPHPPVHILFSSLKTPVLPQLLLPTIHRLGAAQQQCWAWGVLLSPIEPYAKHSASGTQWFSTGRTC